MVKKWLAVATVIVFTLAILDFFVFKQADMFQQGDQSLKYEKIDDAASLPVGLQVGNQAPDFTLPTIEGNMVSLSSFKGKKVILNFWATWCPPCRDEIPHMVKLYEKYKDDDYVIVAVNMTSTESDIDVVKTFVNDHDMTFPILLDEKGELVALYEMIGYPTSFFLDTDGVIRYRITGALDEELLYQEMSRLP